MAPDVLSDDSSDSGPVQVKTFVEGVYAATGRRVVHYIVHARRAILGMKLTPEQNRRIPKLRQLL